MKSNFLATALILFSMASAAIAQSVGGLTLPSKYIVTGNNCEGSGLTFSLNLDEEKLLVYFNNATEFAMGPYVRHVVTGSEQTTYSLFDGTRRYLVSGTFSLPRLARALHAQNLPGGNRKSGMNVRVTAGNASAVCSNVGILLKH